MGKRNYTHVQALLPEIKAMLAEGKTRQEVAEHYGFKDKQVVKKLLERERARQRKLEAGIIPQAKETYHTWRCCGRAGIRDPAFTDGKQAAAGFSVIHRK